MSSLVSESIYRSMGKCYTVFLNSRTHSLGTAQTLLARRCETYIIPCDFQLSIIVLISQGSFTTQARPHCKNIGEKITEI